MKPRIAAIAICALLLLPLLAAATPAAATGAGKVLPNLSWSQLLAAVSQALLPGWGTPATPARSHAPGARPHHRSRGFLMTCDAGTSLDPSGHCVPGTPAH
jgi:hypothetical protein